MRERGDKGGDSNFYFHILAMQGASAGNIDPGIAGGVYEPRPQLVLIIAKDPWHPVLLPPLRDL